MFDMNISVDQTGFLLKSLPGLTVCSQANFYVDGFCYTNPFVTTSIFYTLENVFSEEEDEDVLSYIISSEDSVLVTEDVEVKRIWRFSDPVLQSLADEQEDQERIIIP